MKASPFWTGDPGDYAARSGDPNMPDGFNPFENAPTYSNSKRKRDMDTPNLKAVKNICKYYEQGLKTATTTNQHAR